MRPGPAADTTRKPGALAYSARVSTRGAHRAARQPRLADAVVGDGHRRIARVHPPCGACIVVAVWGRAALLAAACHPAPRRAREPGVAHGLRVAGPHRRVVAPNRHRGILQPDAASHVGGRARLSPPQPWRAHAPAAATHPSISAVSAITSCTPDHSSSIAGSSERRACHRALCWRPGRALARPRGDTRACSRTRLRTAQDGAEECHGRHFPFPPERMRRASST